MDCPECKRLLAAYSFAAREIANAMLAREQASEDDTELLRAIAEAIADMEKVRASAGEELRKHGRSHGENGC